MHIARSSPNGGGISLTDTLQTKTPSDRDPLDRDPPDWDPPRGQTNTCENITFGNFAGLYTKVLTWMKNNIPFKSTEILGIYATWLMFFPF